MKRFIPYLLILIILALIIINKDTLYEKYTEELSKRYKNDRKKYKEKKFSINTNYNYRINKSN